MTKYRIISVKNVILRGRFLQFQTTQTVKRRVAAWWKFWDRRTQDVTIEQWRFIPKELPAKIHGAYLQPEDCPTSFKKWSLKETDFISSFFGHEEYPYPWGLTWFAESYPDIQKYFDNLLFQRIKYKEEKIAERKAETIYL